MPSSGNLLPVIASLDGGSVKGVLLDTAKIEYVRRLGLGPFTEYEELLRGSESTRSMRSKRVRNQQLEESANSDSPLLPEETRYISSDSEALCHLVDVDFIFTHAHEVGYESLGEESIVVFDGDCEFSAGIAWAGFRKFHFLALEQSMFPIFDPLFSLCGFLRCRL